MGLLQPDVVNITFIEISILLLYILCIELFFPTLQPKERFKQMHIKKVLESQETKSTESYEDTPSDLSIRRSNIKYPGLCKQSSNDLHVKAPTLITSTRDNAWDARKETNSLPAVRMAHYLPLRHVEPQSSTAEAAAFQNHTNIVNGSAMHDGYLRSSHVTALPYVKHEIGENIAPQGIRLEARNMPEVRKENIFNPAFHDKMISPPVLRDDLRPSTSNAKRTDNASSNLLIENKDIPVIVSKLDFELNKLKEYRRYNRYTRSDQSDDELTDIDEDELERHEQIRRYHLMTVMSGPPMKLVNNPEVCMFISVVATVTIWFAEVCWNS